MDLVSNDTYEELSPLLRRLNQQHRQIESQMRTLQRKTDEFQQITSHMQEGLVLLDGEKSDVRAFLRTVCTDPTVGILCYDEEIPLLTDKATLLPIGGEQDLEAQARNLFAALRQADGHPHIHSLYAHLPPLEGIGLALYNRCIRAAAHTIKKV